MADKTVQAKVLQVALTTEQWADETTAAKVISKGQVVVEYCTDGSTKVKVGDGVNVFANLPYITGKAVDVEWEDVLNKPAFDTNLTNAGEFADAQAVGNAITAVNTIAGDAYTKANGAYDQANGAYDAANTVAENLTETISNTNYTFTLSSAVTGTSTFTLDALANGITMETTLSNFDAAKITSGTIDIERLPQGALERCVVVTDLDAMLALTSSEVQNGDVVKLNSAITPTVTVADDTALLALTSSDVNENDVVKVTATGTLYIVSDVDALGTMDAFTALEPATMFFIKDETKLGSIDAFEPFSTGIASAVEWTNVLNKPGIDTTVTNGSNNLITSGAVFTAVDSAESNIVAVNNRVTELTSNTNYTLELDGAVAGNGTFTLNELANGVNITTTVNNISASDVGLGAVNNSRQIDAQADANVNTANVVVWGNNGHTVEDAGFAASNVVLDTDTLILNCTL